MKLLQSLAYARAKADPAAFGALTLLDESTGGPVVMAPFHRQFHKEWSHDRSVIHAFPGAGKSQQLKARLAWELWRSPDLRIHWLAGSLAQAERMVDALAEFIESPAVQAVTGGALRVVSKSGGDLVVSGRTKPMKDPSVAAAALGQGSNLGRRADLIVGDDILDAESTRTQGGRDAAWRHFTTNNLSRLMPGGRVWLVGTAWHRDDVLFRASRLDGWRDRAFPVVDDKGRPVWPAFFPADRIAVKRQELGPTSFQREMCCVPLDEQSIIFAAEHIERAMLQGRDPRFSCLGSTRCVLGVDVATATHAKADESAIVLVVVDDFGNNHVADVQAGRWGHEELVGRVVAMARANKATAYIESNGPGAIVADLVAKQAPCKPLPTTRRSKESRVEALAAEMASGRWVFSQPLGYPTADMKKLAAELEVFSFDEHAGDRASALLVAVEGLRLLAQRPKIRTFHLDLHRPGPRAF